jgi:hypothetical protein
MAPAGTTFRRPFIPRQPPQQTITIDSDDEGLTYRGDSSEDDTEDFRRNDIKTTNFQRKKPESATTVPESPASRSTSMPRGLKRKGGELDVAAGRVEKRVWGKFTRLLSEPSDRDNLCARCASFDLDAVFDRQPRTYRGYLIRHIGRLTPDSGTSPCSLCRLFIAMRPLDTNTDPLSEHYSLCAFSSVTAFTTVTKYPGVQNTVTLGVLRTADATRLNVRCRVHSGAVQLSMYQRLLGAKPGRVHHFQEPSRCFCARDSLKSTGYIMSAKSGSFTTGATFSGRIRKGKVDIGLIQSWLSF